MTANDGAGLTDEQWKAIAKTLAGREVDLDQVRRELEELFRGFQMFHARRARNPFRKERDRWRRNYKLASELVAQMPGLAEAKRQAQVRVEYYEMACQAFSGKRDPHHDFLYGGILRIWTDVIGGKLGISHPSPMKGGRSPYGPLVRYFAACVGPILANQTPGPHGIEAIVDRERRARKHTAALGRRWAKKPFIRADRGRR